MKIITRDDALQKLISSMHNGSVKIITGVRRCGKSFLLEKIFRDHLESIGVRSDHIIQVSLDLDEFEELQNPHNLSAYVKKRLRKDGKMNYVFIDEIQLSYKVKKHGINESEVAEDDKELIYLTFYDVLNSLNAIENADIYVTGSNSKMLSEDIATNFRGRRTEVALHPLSFAEFYHWRGGDKSDAWQEYLTFGGLPQVVLANGNDKKAAVLKELFEKVYLKDVVERNKIRSPGLLDSVASVLCSNVGSLTNPLRLEKTMRSMGKDAPSVPTLRKFLGFLTNAYLFRRADRYDVRGRKYLDYPSKYYAEDVGIRNCCLGFREQEETHLMENVIFNELIRRGYSVDVGVVEIEHRDGGSRELRQHEIDFVVNTGFEKIYIQSAFGMNDPKQREREILPLSKTGDSFRKLVVTDGNQHLWQDASGIAHVGIYQFLLDRKVLLDIVDDRYE